MLSIAIAFGTEKSQPDKKNSSGEVLNSDGGSHCDCRRGV